PCFGVTARTDLFPPITQRVDQRNQPLSCRREFVLDPSRIALVLGATPHGDRAAHETVDARAVEMVTATGGTGARICSAVHPLLLHSPNELEDSPDEEQ